MKTAVFFDIDGTLWDSQMQIPKSTIDAIHKLQENGNYAFICSGRSRDKNKIAIGKKASPFSISSSNKVCV